MYAVLEIVDDSYVVPSRQEMIDGMGADEACSPRDQNVMAHSVCFFHFSIPIVALNDGNPGLLSLVRRRKKNVRSFTLCKQAG